MMAMARLEAALGTRGQQQQVRRRRRQRLDTMSCKFAGWGAERVKAWVETQLS